MTPREYAHAQAVNEFEAMHGGPAEWAPWEEREYSLFVPLREERLLNAAEAAAAREKQLTTTTTIPAARSAT